MNEEILTRSLPDGGPLYRETNLERFIAEPWNAGSSLVFILVAVFFLFRIGKSEKAGLLLTLAPVILLIGGLGGTLYHAFRVSSFFLFLDVAPIYILIFGTSCYLWARWAGNTRILFFVLPFFILMDSLIFYVFPLVEQWKQHLSYLNMGCAAVLPLIAVLLREKFSFSIFALVSLGSYMLGLFFRILDAWEPPVMSSGTHWLWHLCCAAGTGFFLEFLIRLVKVSPVKGGI
jgi:hemolysin III